MDILGEGVGIRTLDRASEEVRATARVAEEAGGRDVANPDAINHLIGIGVGATLLVALPALWVLASTLIRNAKR